MDWFIWLLFGHLFADYAFQTSWMAINKKDLLVACFVHCLVYTCIVTLFLSWGAGIKCTALLYTLIFASHWVLDYTSLVDKWIRLIGSRSWDTNLPKVQGPHKVCNTFSHIAWSDTPTVQQVVQVAFGAIIYVVIDNTTHLFMMFIIVKSLI